jgi:two-component system, NarL family, response regulator DevR
VATERRGRGRLRLDEAWTQYGQDPAGISVLVADSQELIAEALAELLGGLGLRVAGVAGSVAELLDHVAAQPSDVLVMDAGFEPDGAPLAALAPVRELAPAIRAVVVADEVDARLTLAAGEQQIDGLVLKASAGVELVAATTQVVAGHAVFPGGWLGAVHNAEHDSPLALLSARQREVLELVAQGLPNERIAARLFISPNTVKFHVRVIYERLGVHNRVEAARVLAGRALAPQGVD